MNQLLDSLPPWTIYAVAGVGVLIVLLALKMMFGGKAKPKGVKKSSLLENLADYPPAPGGALDCRLLIDKIPVRLRLVVLAPVGDLDLNLDDAEAILDRLAPRLGDVVRQDRPRVVAWPRQVSGAGFAQQFGANVATPDGDDAWSLIAGRAKIGKRALMIGMAAQAKTPMTPGVKTLDVNDWAALLQVRVK